MQLLISIKKENGIQQFLISMMPQVANGDRAYNIYKKIKGGNKYV